MSRSYKKHPYSKDSGKGKKFAKRRASKVARKSTDLEGKGGNYKKCFCSYDICDWKWGEHSVKEVVKDLIDYYEKGFISKEEILREFHSRIGK